MTFCKVDVICVESVETVPKLNRIENPIFPIYSLRTRNKNIRVPSGGVPTYIVYRIVWTPEIKIFSYVLRALVSLASDARHTRGPIFTYVLQDARSTCTI